MKQIKVYVAGSHPFWSDIEQQAFYNLVAALSEKYNIEALVPKDGDVVVTGDEKDPYLLPTAIYCKNIEAIKSCDAIVADMTPFRGVSADAGTIYEIGYARGINKAVILYTHDQRDYKTRAEAWVKTNNRQLEDKIEDFKLSDNLMITRSFDNVYTDIANAFAAVYNMFNYTRE